MGNALGKKMDTVMPESKSLLKGKFSGYCLQCDMMLTYNDAYADYFESADGVKTYFHECPRCGYEGGSYNKEDHATRHQPKGGAPWKK